MAAKTNDRATLDGLQVLRGIAAIAVVLFHACIIFGSGAWFATGDPTTHRLFRVFSFGNAGVDLFFVLSGFIIAHAHWNDPPGPMSARRYGIRRLTRIYPLTLAIVILTLAALPLLRTWTGDPDFATLGPARIVASLTLLPLGCERIPGALWSLTNEMTFYSVFATVFIGKRVFAVAMTLWVALILTQAAQNFAPGLAACSSDPLSLFNGLFPLGLGAFFLARWLRGRGVAGWTVPLLVAGTVLALAIAASDVVFLSPVYFGETDEPRRVAKLLTRGGYGLASALLVSGATLLDWRATGAPARFARLLGDASFSIYLVHEMILATGARLLGTAPPYAATHAGFLFAASICACVLTGVICHLTLERWLIGAAQRTFEPDRSELAAG